MESQNGPSQSILMGLPNRCSNNQLGSQNETDGTLLGSPLRFKLWYPILGSIGKSKIGTSQKVFNNQLGSRWGPIGKSLNIIAIFKIVGTAVLCQLFEQVCSLIFQSIVSPSNRV
jgi:hypothetical protein